jgi:ribose/xylose/arabinose/galactoside ABC-type transport system permease subunit
MKRILGLVIINIVAMAVFGLLTPHFLSKANLIVMIDHLSLEAIALSGYMLLLVGGNFDLSTDGIVALTGVLAGLMMVNGVNWVLAVLIALTCASMIGLFNGYIVSKVGINGLIATLTTWWICIGITFGLTKAIAPFGFSDTFQLLGQARILGFRSTVLYAIIIATVLSIVLHRTKLGSHLYLSGDNKKASEMMGINTVHLGIGTYALVGLLAGFIGIMMTSRLDAASPSAVDGMVLRVIAASVIGGANLSGGKGSIIGGLLGLFLMGILSNAVIQLGVSPYWQKAILGSILLVTVLSEQFKLTNRRKNE